MIAKYKPLLFQQLIKAGFQMTFMWHGTGQKTLSQKIISWEVGDHRWRVAWRMALGRKRSAKRSSLGRWETIDGVQN